VEKDEKLMLMVDRGHGGQQKRGFSSAWKGGITL